MKLDGRGRSGMVDGRLGRLLVKLVRAGIGTGRICTC